MALAALPGAFADADIVISGTSADGFIVGPEEVRPVMAGRNGRGLLFIDIAVPRDVDPAVTEIKGVHLLDIDDIETVTAHGMNGRQSEVEAVETIVDEELSAFVDWWRSLDVVPVIAALRERAEEIRQRELERTLARLPDLDDRVAAADRGDDGGDREKDAGPANRATEGWRGQRPVHGGARRPVRAPRRVRPALVPERRLKLCRLARL